MLPAGCHIRPAVDQFWHTIHPIKRELACLERALADTIADGRLATRLGQRGNALRDRKNLRYCQRAEPRHRAGITDLKRRTTPDTHVLKTLPPAHIDSYGQIVALDALPPSVPVRPRCATAGQTQVPRCAYGVTRRGVTTRPLASLQATTYLSPRDNEIIILA